jgi:hypothetical protein
VRNTFAFAETEHTVSERYISLSIISLFPYFLRSSVVEVPRASGIAIANRLYKYKNNTLI